MKVDRKANYSSFPESLLGCLICPPESFGSCCWLHFSVRLASNGLAALPLPPGCLHKTVLLVMDDLSDTTGLDLLPGLLTWPGLLSIAGLLSGWPEPAAGEVC